MALTTWINQPKAWSESNNSIRIEARGSTDLFIDAQGRSRQNNAPLLCQAIEGDFRITCRLRPDFISTYDAGALVVFQDGEHWIKYAFEMTDLGYTSLVSVVTNGISDDCNGEPFHEAVWLRITRKGNVWGLHFSADGIAWMMSRYFAFDMEPILHVGLLAQSPMGDGCVVDFSSVRIEKVSVIDVRQGE